MANSIHIEVQGLLKQFGEVNAVNRVDFSVKEGEFVTLLGPSGSGKTTALRCIAGLEKIDGGRILIGNEVVAEYGKINIPPENRAVGMVFQSYAIWPHLQVFDNVAYPLQVRKLPKNEIAKRVEEVLHLVGLAGFESRYGTQLSGGQQQRVALARALVFRPQVLLFDEPLSNLDAKLRERMRVELVRLQKEIATTSLYVTHDQAEAMVVSDRIIIMDHGKIIQEGNSHDIYFKPVNRFVAEFIGESIFFNGKLVEVQNGSGHVAIPFQDHSVTVCCHLNEKFDRDEPITLCIRPEDIELLPSAEFRTENCFKGVISQIHFMGNHTDCRVQVGDKEIKVQAPKFLPYKVKEDVVLRIKPETCVVLKKDSSIKT